MIKTSMVLWVALAAAEVPADPGDTSCQEPIPALIEEVRQGEVPSSCLLGPDEAGKALLDAVVAGGAGADRLARALTTWRMERLEERIPDAEARALPASERRLLRDAIQARHGRASPAPEHEAIFAARSWYKPDPKYTNARLTAQDKENMALLDRPPPEPKAAPPAAAAMAESTPATGAKSGGRCGCQTGAGLPGLVALGLAALGARRRTLTRT